LVTNLVSAFKAVALTSGLDQRGGLTHTSRGQAPQSLFLMQRRDAEGHQPPYG
jgi:hypothetical protein